MLAVYYLQSFSVSLSFNMPRTKVKKSILGRFVPFSLVSLRVTLLITTRVPFANSPS